MGDIELVIKIPEELYKQQFGSDWVGNILIHDAIINGTPLPKGHGRLIDVDELEECKEIMNTIMDESKYAVMMDDIRNTSTIIEADKESEDKAIVYDTSIPDNVTNGDVIKTMFPQIIVNNIDDMNKVYISIPFAPLKYAGANIDATKDWWDALYKTI